MSNNINTVDFTKYGCFVSYGQKAVSTSKPGVDNYYVKDAYKDIANYNNRKIKFFEDKSRWSSVYDSDVVKPIKQESYMTRRAKDSTLLQYEYSHDNNLRQIVTERVPIKNREEEIRERLYLINKFSAKSTNSFERQKMFSHFVSTYDHDNQIVQENLKNNFKKSEIPYWFKNKYHKYQKGQYTSEHTGTYGVHGDIPYEKFFNNTQVPGKLYSDNYEIGKGTAKASDKLVGYKGFIPNNDIPNNNTHVTDPYINVLKANHLINYKTRIPGYQGNVPVNASNVKGNLRPYCLSTQDEKF